MSILDDNMCYEILFKKTFKSEKDPFEYGLADINQREYNNKDKKYYDLRFAVAICCRKLYVDLQNIEDKDNLYEKYSQKLYKNVYKLLYSEISYEEIHNIIRFCLDFINISKL